MNSEQTTAALTDAERDLLHTVATLSWRGRRGVAMYEIAESMGQRGLLGQMIRLRDAGLVICAIASNGGWRTTALGHSTLFGEG